MGRKIRFGKGITVPYAIGLHHGSLTVFPAGTRRFLSAGWRRVPDGITRAGSAWYPYGSRLIFINRDPCDNPSGSRMVGLYHAGPGWVIPSGTRLHPADKSRRVPAGNTVRAPWGMTYGIRAGTVWVCWLGRRQLIVIVIAKIPN